MVGMEVAVGKAPHDGLMGGDDVYTVTGRGMPGKYALGGIVKLLRLGSRPCPWVCSSRFIKDRHGTLA